MVLLDGEERGWVYERADHEIAWVALLAPPKASNHSRCRVAPALHLPITIARLPLRFNAQGED